MNSHLPHISDQRQSIASSEAVSKPHEHPLYDGAAALIMDTDALVRGSTIGDGSGSGGGDTGTGDDTGSSGEGICGSGDDHGESGDGGGDGMARSLAISASDQNGIGGCSRIDILAVTRCTGGGTESASHIIREKREKI
ncbi:hypothetical protein Tco_1527514 [Tanacetum coccineum]